ncbi:MAG: Hsp70 family protein [Chloroflexota bacterium]
MLSIGIDLGTTNTSAAYCGASEGVLIPLEGGETVMPSTLCFEPDATVHYGREAIQLYLSRMGRTPIRYKLTDLRALTSVFEDELQGEFVDPEHGLVIVSSLGGEDAPDLPARLFQSLKSALRDPSFHGATVFGRYHAIEELLALVLRRVREHASAYLGAAVEAAAIGRPVTYAPSVLPAGLSAEHIDRVASERMLVAARLAGFTHAALELEPVAAARRLRRMVLGEGPALVFDFGGGTLDLALVRAAGEARPEILATRGLRLGGDDLDSAIMEHGLLKHFGAGSTVGPKHLPFPPNLIEPLLHWQTIALLAMPATAARIAAIKRPSNAPACVERLQTLVREGLGFRLFQLIEAAKIELSGQPTSAIVLRHRGLEIAERLTRGQFVAAITPHLGSIERALGALLATADLPAEAVGTVLMTGGSSLVPIVQATVRRIFPGARVQVADPFTSIAAGLSIMAAQDDVCQPLDHVTSAATSERIRAEAVAIGQRVRFVRGDQAVEGLVVGRAGGSLHDAFLVIEFWDAEIEEFVSTIRHETKVTCVADA